MSILIADSGSTKTDWVLLNNGQVNACAQTQGINPFHQSEEVIAAILHDELLPQISVSAPDVYFYGSGVRPEFESVMCRLLYDIFPESDHIEAHGDLLGAAIAVCGREAGLAAILGTGANSCLYDGACIVKNTPPLGYILGDEGSGAVLGIRFLNALLKGRLSESLRTTFFEKIQMTEGEIISRVYRQPMANRWLASLSSFIRQHLDEPSVRDIVVNNFRDFFRRNLVPYGRPDLPVGAVGSVAWYYRNELAEAARQEGFALGRIERSPMDALIHYYSA